MGLISSVFTCLVLTLGQYHRFPVNIGTAFAPSRLWHAICDGYRLIPVKQNGRFVGVHVSTCNSGICAPELRFQRICFGSDSDRNIVFCSCRCRIGSRCRGFSCNFNVQYSGSSVPSNYRNTILVYINAEHIGVIRSIRFNCSLAGIGECLCFTSRNVEACLSERFTLSSVCGFHHKRKVFHYRFHRKEIPVAFSKDLDLCFGIPFAIGKSRVIAPQANHCTHKIALLYS